jgi:hypothetical protein
MIMKKRRNRRMRTAMKRRNRTRRMVLEER